MRDSGLSILAALALAVALSSSGALLGCRGESGERDRAERAGATTPHETDGAPAAKLDAGPGDPFAGIESLRPAPWATWPLENVDPLRYAGWRIDPVSGGFERVTGLVLAAEPEAFVLAVAAGEVVAIEPTEDEGELELRIDHGNGIESRYSPLSGVLAPAELAVERGAAVGLGAGRSLRLRVTVDGVDIDPLLALRQPLHRWSSG